MANLLQGDEVAGLPVARVESLAVHPPRGVAVAAHLHVVPERLRADRAAFVQEAFYFLQDKGVAFERGAVVGFLVPDVGPDVLGFCRSGQAAEAFAKLGDGFVQPLVHDRS
ncbi:hypothetical protein [Actinosynnema sp. NPDC023587]|uniref:hypothetical protein n=1 Tax=Actinosynnema sp. NPDC023587 TaxID=3154695 RepID=UPI0033D73680